MTKFSKEGVVIDLTNANWFKSTRSSNDGSCVEVAFVDSLIAVRDSKNPDGPKLIFTKKEWRAFLGGAKANEFDLNKS